MGVFSKRDNAEDLKDLVKAGFQGETFADDRHQHLNRDGDPDWSLHRVLADAVEGFESSTQFREAEHGRTEEMEEDQYFPSPFKDFQGLF